MKGGAGVAAAVATLCMLLLLERTAQAVHTEQLTGPCRGRDRAMLCLALGPEHSNSSSNSSQDLGLMNQHLAVINFVTLGVVLGADELELPLLQSRSSLAAFATWTARDPAGLWNTTLLRSYLAGRNINLSHGNRSDARVSVLPDLQLDARAPREYGDVADAVRAHLASAAGKAGAAEGKVGGRFCPPVRLTLFRLLTAFVSRHSSLRLEVARNLLFTDALRGLADKAVSVLQLKTGWPAFNGVHLHTINDFTRALGVDKATLPAYLAGLKGATLNASLPLYIASSVFETQPDFARKWQHGCGSSATHLTALLDARELGPLRTEQRAAVDFLVLVRAAKFVGLQLSTFSFFVAEQRKAGGLFANHLIQLANVSFPNDFLVHTNSLRLADPLTLPLFASAS